MDQIVSQGPVCVWTQFVIRTTEIVIIIMNTDA